MQTINSSRQPVPDRISQHWCSGEIFLSQVREKLIPLTTTSQSGPDQPPLCFRPTYALPDQGPLIADPSIFPERERAGVDRVSGVNGPLYNFEFSVFICFYCLLLYVQITQIFNTSNCTKMSGLFKENER